MLRSCVHRGKDFFGEGEAEEILRRAIRKAEPDGVTRQRLMEMARELGIPEEDVSNAEAEMAAEQKSRLANARKAQERTRFILDRRRKTLQNFGGSVALGSILIAAWWATGGGYFWPAWILVPTVIGMVASLFSSSEGEFERWQRTNARRAQFSDKEMHIFLDSLPKEIFATKLLVIKQVREIYDLTLEQSMDVVEDYLRTKKSSALSATRR